MHTTVHKCFVNIYKVLGRFILEGTAGPSELVDLRAIASLRRPGPCHSGATQQDSVTAAFQMFILRTLFILRLHDFALIICRAIN